jgi:hypothetical protein
MTSTRRPSTTSDNAARIWQKRTDLVKHEMAVASAAADAKTAKLRALRLEKEAEEAKAAPIVRPAPAVRRKRK